MDIIYDSGPKVIERGLRISFTFRWLRKGGCKCSYRDQCDSQQTAESSINLDSEASRLEAQHVHQVYNKISSHFSQTRYRAWPHVAEFVSSLPCGSVLFDVGCGNGKYFGLNRNIFEVGGDRSDGLLSECCRRGFEAVQCDCLQLPLRSGSVDGLICIAVIHHLSTHSRRVAAVREMARVLRQGGRGLVYVWAKDQLRDNVPSKYLKQVCEIVGKQGVKKGEGMEREFEGVDRQGEKKVERKGEVGKDGEEGQEEKGEKEMQRVGAVGKEGKGVARHGGGLKTEGVRKGEVMKIKNGAVKRDGEGVEVKEFKRDAEVNEDGGGLEGEVEEMKKEREGEVEKEEELCNRKEEVIRREERVEKEGKGIKGEGEGIENAKESLENDKPSEFSLPVHNNRTQFKHDDILVPWTNKKETFLRYYHVFKEGELEALCSSVSEIRVEKVYYDQGNWCVIFEKCGD